MQILAIEKGITPLDLNRHQKVLREEAACVWDLKKKEIIRDIWFTRRNRIAVIMLECGTEEEAKQHLDSLPLVREGFIAFDIMPLRTYDGFARLIATEAQKA